MSSRLAVWLASAPGWALLACAPDAAAPQTLGSTGGVALAGQGGGSIAGAAAGGAAAGAAAIGGSDAAGQATAAGTGGVAGGAAAGNGGGGSAAVSTGCEGSLLCDDFEGYTPGAAPTGKWTVETAFGAVSVDATKSFSGTKSVKVTTEAVSEWKKAFLVAAGAPLFPLPGNAFYGRMMYFIGAAPSKHSTFIVGGGIVAGAEPYPAVYRYGGSSALKVNDVPMGSLLMAAYETTCLALPCPEPTAMYEGNGPRSDCGKRAALDVIVENAWACIEWQFDGPNNQLRLWIDDSLIDSVSVDGKGTFCGVQGPDFTWTAPSFDHLQLGWETYAGSDVERIAYIDDVVISTNKVGCPAQFAAQLH